MNFKRRKPDKYFNAVINQERILRYSCQITTELSVTNDFGDLRNTLPNIEATKKEIAALIL